MRTFEQLYNEIRDLRGATVNVFGRPTTLDSSYDDNDFIIDTLDLLDAIKEYAVDPIDYFEDIPEIMDAWNHDSWDIDFELMDLLVDYGFMSEYKDSYRSCNNSYNWSSPLSNDIDYRLFDDNNGGMFAFIQVHKFGDVRGNYAGFCLFHFNNDYEFFEVSSECDKYIELDVDGVVYSIGIRWTSDTYEVFDNDGDYICDAYGDSDDVIERIRESVA